MHVLLSCCAAVSVRCGGGLLMTCIIALNDLLFQKVNDIQKVTRRCLALDYLLQYLCALPCIRQMSGVLHDATPLLQAVDIVQEINAVLVGVDESLSLVSSPFF